MSSKELKELEFNKLIHRSVLNTQPVTEEYTFTNHGNTLKTIINYLKYWEIELRKKIVEG